MPTIQPSTSPTSPTFKPTALPSLLPTAKNDDTVQVAATTRVNFVDGDSLNNVSLATLTEAFRNISGYPDSTTIVSTTLVSSSSPSGKIRRVLQTITSFFTYDIRFLNRYKMSAFPGYNSTQIATTQVNLIEEKIITGSFATTLRSLAKVLNATQLINGTCYDVVEFNVTIISAPLTPPPPPPPSILHTNPSGNSLSKEKVVAIVLSVLIGTFLIGFALYLYLHRIDLHHRRKKHYLHRYSEDESSKAVEIFL